MNQKLRLIRKTIIIFTLFFLLGFTLRPILSFLRLAFSVLNSALHHLSSLVYTASSVLLALVAKAFVVPALVLQGSLSWAAVALKKLAHILLNLVAAAALWLAAAAYEVLKDVGPRIGRAASKGFSAVAEWVQRILVDIWAGVVVIMGNCGEVLWSKCQVIMSYFDNTTDK